MKSPRQLRCVSSLQFSLIGSLCGCIQCQGGGERDCNFEGCLSG